MLTDLDGDAPVLIVTFGGIAGGIGGVPPFELFRTLDAGPPVRKIFVRDHRHSWYHRGVRGLGRDIDGVKNGLEQAIASASPAKLVTIGASAGGYAALLFGRLLGADEAHAFSPQTFLSPQLRHQYGDDRWAQLLPALARAGELQPQYTDLQRVFEREGRPESRFTIHYSSSDRLDERHALHLSRSEEVELRAHSTGGHTLIRDLRDSGELAHLIERLARPLSDQP